jgi:opacity protein-like surface antigen
MKRIFLAAILALAASTLAIGVAHADSHNPNPVEKALLKIEAELIGALARNDAAVFERQLADSFTFIGPDGTVQDRAQWLADLKSGALKMASSANDQFKVQVYGKAAVVTYRSTDKGTYKGVDISGQYRWTDVFVKKGTRWLVVATHGTPIPKQ